ncbi:MAG: GNAT family protein [Planctomycetota bacterium]|nr:GNAT family protein [Planctomycetota bacterium]
MPQPPATPGTFRTERLVVGPFEAADASALFAYRCSPEIQRFQPWSPESEAAVADFLAGQELAALTTRDARLQLAIRSRGRGTLVGDLGLHVVGAGASQVEVGFTIAPEHQGRGLGTEAVRGLLGHLFEDLGKHRVLASVDPGNAASLALLRRLGLRLEAHHIASYHFRGRWVDDLVFAMLRSEWLGGELGSPPAS